MENVLQAFGKTVRRLRVDRDLSQEDIADKSKLHRTYISDVELGKRNISLENIAAIADALDLPLSELFREVEKDACV